MSYTIFFFHIVCPKTVFICGILSCSQKVLHKFSLICLNKDKSLEFLTSTCILYFKTVLLLDFVFFKLIMTSVSHFSSILFNSYMNFYFPLSPTNASCRSITMSIHCPYIHNDQFLTGFNSISY